MAAHMENGGSVIWITGLSGAGKTTLAKALQKEFPGSILLDGDELRTVLGAATGAFGRDARFRLAQIYARLAALLAGQGRMVIVATISLFHELHAWNRKNLPGYLEIFLDVGEAERRRRDPKNLYAANTPQMAGAIAELPLKPHLVLTEAQTLEESLLAVKNCIKGQKTPKNPASQNPWP